MLNKNKKYNGYLMTELMVSLIVLGTILAAFATSLAGFKRLNHYQLVRQRCVSAAQAQLNSIAVTGKPIDAQDFERLWPKMSVSIRQLDGTGQWEGLQLLQITTKTNSFNRKVEVQLCKYITANTTSQKKPKSITLAKLER